MSYLYDDEEEYNVDYFRPELDPEGYYMDDTEMVFTGKEWMEFWEDAYKEGGQEYLRNLDDQGLNYFNHGLIEVEKDKKGNWVEV